MTQPKEDPITPHQAKEIHRLAKAVLWKHQKDIEKGRLTAIAQ
jgi:hypothetical protein